MSQRWKAPTVPKVTGVGLTSDRARRAMLDALRQSGLRDERVLAGLGLVSRHLFIQPGLVSRAYEDVALPIGHEQTISKPSTVARMIEIGIHGRENLKKFKVLEVGTGCGYQAAVLAQIFGEVYSIERIGDLHELARANLRPLLLGNVRLVFGDGLLGIPSAAPFDFITVAAAGLAIPDALLLQMAIGGRLVAPVADGTGDQSLHLVERAASDDWRLTRLDGARFVPLLAGTRTASPPRNLAGSGLTQRAKPKSTR